MKFNQTEVAYSFHDLNVNKDTGVISKVLLARVGKVKGHGMYADSTFTSQIVEKGNEFGNVGMKARFGHPNASSTTLGTFIGRWHNFEFEDGNAYADLHLDKITKKVQVDGKGISMWDYVTEMASSNPDMFGNSIVFRPAKSEFKRVEVANEDIDRQYDEIINEGEEKSTVLREFARIDSLTASDLVDSPAATESLFESFNTDEDFAYHMTTFLDSNPKIYELLSNHPEVIDGFLNKYEDYKSNKIKMANKEKELSSDETLLGSILKKFGYEKIKEEEVVEDVEEKEEDEKEEVEEVIEETPEVEETEKEELSEEAKLLAEKEDEIKQLKEAAKEQAKQLAKFTTKPAGAKPKADPKIDGTILSESDKNYDEVAKDFRDNK